MAAQRTRPRQFRQNLLLTVASDLGSNKNGTACDRMSVYLSEYLTDFLPACLTVCPTGIFFKVCHPQQLKTSRSPRGTVCV